MAKRRIDQAIHESLALAEKRSCRPSLMHILAVVQSHTELLRPQPIGGQCPFGKPLGVIHAVLALAQRPRYWLRPVEDWIPQPGPLVVQVGSLAVHLLATHPVPKFMARVWLENPPLAWHLKLYRHVALGHSVRGAALPLRLTRPMAELFMQAPDHLTVDQALRWSEVRGLGGNDRIANVVLSTPLGTELRHEAYWERVLRFLIGCPRLDLAEVGPLIEFLHVRPDAFPSLAIERPSRRRSSAVLAEFRNWQRVHLPRQPRRHLTWRACGIGGFRYAEPRRQPRAARIWTIHELLDSRELKDEGRALRHCVAGYASMCAQRRSSIWSLASHGSLDSQRVVTIEVEPTTRRIVEARGRCNRKPEEDACRVIKLWAHRKRLTLAEGLL